MERKIFLELCRSAAFANCIETGVIPENLIVKYGNQSYFPFKYELSFNKDGSVRHAAVLHDLKAKAVVYAPLDKVVQ